MTTALQFKSHFSASLKTALLGMTFLAVATTANAQIAITYLQAVKHLEADFSFEGSGSSPSNRKIVGQSKDGLALIELVGDLDSLTSASLTIGVPNDSEAARARNAGRLLRFVANTVPEWKGNNRWVNASLKKIVNGDFSDRSTTIGSKRVTMRSIKEGGIVLTTVEKR
jgi:hypothetical protein